MRSLPQRISSERGSISLEFVLVAPAMLLLLSLVVVYGRVAEFNGRLESATRDAARAATFARSLTAAQKVAQEIVTDALPKNACNGAPPTVTLRDNQFVPGGLVTVETTCKYPLRDASYSVFPGTITKHVSFSSLLDKQRGVDTP